MVSDEEKSFNAKKEIELIEAASNLEDIEIQQEELSSNENKLDETTETKNDSSNVYLSIPIEESLLVKESYDQHLWNSEIKLCKYVIVIVILIDNWLIY